MKLLKKAGTWIVGLALAMIVQNQIVAGIENNSSPQTEIYSVELKEASEKEQINSSNQRNTEEKVHLQIPTQSLPADGLSGNFSAASLPIVWQQVKSFERVPEGPVEVPFWQATTARTSLFGIHPWKAEGNGNAYSIAASNKVGAVTAEYRQDQLFVTFYNAKVSLKKSQTEYPTDQAIRRVRVENLSQTVPSAVQMVFELKPATKDFVIGLDELGERVLVEMITNAVTGVILAEKGEEEVLTIESLKPIRVEPRRGPERSVEIEVPSAKSLLQNQEAFLNAKFIQRMAVSDWQKGKTKITVWLREDVEFEPEGQSIRFFSKKTKNLKYSHGILVLKRPENFQMAEVDYILDVHKRKASLAFPYQGYIEGNYWIADSFIRKIEAKNGRLEFSFPEAYELTIAEDRDAVYISAKKPKDIFTKVVFIDVGHGGEDPGAVRRIDLGSGYREYTEKEANLTVALLLREKLKKNPEIKAYFSRLTDENPSAYTRAKLANEVGADFFLSLHNNMTTVKDRKIEGTDIYYLAGRKKGNLTTENLAKILLKNYKEITSFANRNMHSAPHLYMVKYPQMPAAIVESGFMSDDEDLKKMFDPQEQEKTAEALYQSIVEAFGYLQLP